MTDSRPVRVRFAPSPTGDLHIGGLRTALFDWLFARHFGGKFILRIEDTDQKRTQEQSLAGILSGLKWAGLDWDEGPDIGGPYGPYIQSQRLPMYQEWAKWLVDRGLAYRAYETPDELKSISQANKDRGYDRRARSLTPDDWARLDAEGKPYVIRFKVPLGGETTVNDMVRGPITVDNEAIQDAVLLKADGFPTYHFAVIVDDHFMEISHITRAEEWLPSAPLHKLLFQAFGWEVPEFAHFPVIFAQDGTKLSKRKHPEAALSLYIKDGYLPEALINYLCNVGWNYGVKDEKGEEIQIFTARQVAEVFDITRVSKGGTKYDLAKLQWLNGEYIRRMPVEQLTGLLRKPLEEAGLKVDEDRLRRVVPLVQERIKLLKDVVEKAGLFFQDGFTPPKKEDLIIKKLTPEQSRDALQKAYDTLAGLQDFSHTAQEAVMRPLAESLGLKPGPYFTAIRMAVTGQTVSPPLFETMEILGREVVLQRLGDAIKVLSE